MSKIVIYTDGGAIGNPGPAAIGVVIQQKTANNPEGEPSVPYRARKQRTKNLPLAGLKLSTEKRYSEYIGETTNNQAEYQALIFALKKAKSLFGKKKIKNSEAKCCSDSQLLVNQLQGKYKILEKGLQPLFIEIWNLKQDFKNVSFNYIPRERNKEADRLVKSELSKLS